VGKCRAACKVRRGSFPHPPGARTYFLGKGRSKVTIGERVVVAFPIACGECEYCRREEYSLCHESNLNRSLPHKVFGNHTAAIYGYPHMFGGIPGGQAKYVRVPFADVGTLKVPPSLPDEKVLFLTDVLPTGWQAAVNCDLKGGETVAVWGCGPVGQFAIRSARMLGAERMIAIDHVPERLELARRSGAEPANFDEAKIHDHLMEATHRMPLAEAAEGYDFFLKKREGVQKIVLKP
jgi:threonine dehydrogenase-like Zn-dependent dehydrogenase